MASDSGDGNPGQALDAALAFPKLAPFFAEEIDRPPRRIVSDGRSLSSAHNDTSCVGTLSTRRSCPS